jgi:hypothetical protein
MGGGRAISSGFSAWAHLSHPARCRIAVQQVIKRSLCGCNLMALPSARCCERRLQGIRMLVTSGPRFLGGIEAGAGPLNYKAPFDPALCSALKKSGDTGCCATHLAALVDGWIGDHDTAGTTYIASMADEHHRTVARQRGAGWSDSWATLLFSLAPVFYVFFRAC